MFGGYYCRQDGPCVLSSGCAIRSPQLRVSTPSHHRCCYVLLPSSSTQELRHMHSQVRPSDTCVLALLSQLSAELVLQPTVRQSHQGDTPQTHLKAPTILSPNICNSDFPLTCSPSMIALLHLVANYIWRNTKLQKRNEQEGNITTLEVVVCIYEYIGHMSSTNPH